MQRVNVVVAYIVAAALGCTACMPLPASIPANAALAKQGETVSVHTPLGQIDGLRKKGINTFQGIPYARPPVGDLRFAPPVPVPPHDQPIAALRISLDFSQVDDESSSEDALYLNIWTQADPAPQEGAEPAKRPVYVFIHGGAFATGGSSKPTFDGSVLASKGIVVVTINYRLNAPGFLFLSAAAKQSQAENGLYAEGNYGILDQIQALRWVAQNIAAFGGDPQNVTIGGESAGAISVSMLMLAPLAKGLFHKAILESGNLLDYSAMLGFANSNPTLARAVSQRFAKMFGAQDDAAGLETLRKLPVQVLTQACAFESNFTKTAAFTFWPVFDGIVLPADPYQALQAGQLNAVPILWGYNTDEASLFMPAVVSQAQYEAYLYKSIGVLAEKWFEKYPITEQNTPTQAMADYIKTGGFRLGNHIFSDYLTQQGIPAYAYHFDCKSPVSTLLGSYHSMEMSYIFGSGAEALLLDETGKRISAQMQTLWTNFIKNGDPNKGEPLPMGGQWPKYDKQAPMQAYFGETFETEPLEAPEKLAFLEALLFGDTPYYLH